MNTIASNETMPPFNYQSSTKSDVEEEHQIAQPDSNHRLKNKGARDHEEIKAVPLFSTINWPIHVKKIEHSLSDVSEFNITSRSPISIGLKELGGIPADFVHLHGVGLHSKEQINSNQHPPFSIPEEKERFRLRSIQRSISSVGYDKGTKTIVVVPSLDLDQNELTRMCEGHTVELYEERQLYHLLMANDPTLRIIYLTSNKVEEKVILYYLRLCQNENSSNCVPMSSILPRVIVISVPSERYNSLTDKILGDNRLLNFVKDAVHRGNPSKDSAGLVPLTGSDSVDKLSNKLGIKLLEASGDCLHFGTKQGSREIFAACGIPHPAGTPSQGDDDLLTYGNKDGNSRSWADNHRYIRSSSSLAIGIARQILIHRVCPKKWMVKLNQGFSGKGNASLDLRRLQEEYQFARLENIDGNIRRLAARIEEEFEGTMKFEDPSMTWFGNDKHNGFQQQISRLGVIAEAFVEGEVPTSPSIQAVVEPAEGRVSIISTHEQILNGQVYYGCINPASEQYRAQIMEMGLKVAKFLLEHGVRGHFSCDFIATKKADDAWELHAVEINLRQGGTSHPQATMALLCGGCICSDGIFRTNNNEMRTYVATDCQNIKPCSEDQVINAIESKTDPLACKIQWDKSRCVGVVLHMLKFATKGRIGFTAIGRDVRESQRLFDAAQEFLSRMN